MAPVVFENFATLAETTLTANPSTGTSLAVTSRTLFPPSGIFRLLVQDAENDKTHREIMYVTGGYGTGAGTFTVVRGQEGTTNVAHPTSSYVAAELTAEAIKRWVPEYVWQPRHQNFLAWTGDPGAMLTSSGIGPTAGVA